MGTESNYTVSTVKKAISLLKLFNGQNRELTLTQISTLSGIDKSTTFRLLYTLNEEGFVDYDEETKKYSLGIEVYRLGQLKYRYLDIRQIAKKHLQKFCDTYDFVSYLGIRNGDHLVMVERIFPYNVPVWARFFVEDDYRELYSTGIGRLFLAEETDAAIEKYFSRVEIKPMTDCTITDKDVLLDLIRQARIDHYSGNLGENETSIHSLCVPIYDHSGKMSAGISICGPKDTIWDKNFDDLLEKLQTIASNISRECGYNT